MSLFLRKRDPSEWHTTTGTVEEFSWSEDDDTAEILGVYKVAGEFYTYMLKRQFVFGGAEKWAESVNQTATVFVRYNPDDPQEYVVEGLPE